MHSLIDIRKDESKLKESHFYLNILIIFCFSLTIFSYVISLNPKYYIKSNLRTMWLTIGLISNLIAGGLSSNKLPKLETKINEIESDSTTYEETNRRIVLSSGNHHLENTFTSFLNPVKEESDPFLDTMMKQIMSAPIGNNTNNDSPIAPITPTEINNNLEFYNWADCVEEAVGFIISGNSGSGKTSVACWLAGILTKEKPAQVLALDPHYNDIWEEVNITAIGKIEDIENILIWLLNELNFRCELKSQKQNLGDDLIIFCDEVNACLERFNEPKNIESAIKRLGSEGRKFGITFIMLNQSHNAGDLGISKKYLNNYFMIALCASARAIIDENYRQGSPEKDYIKSTPYPCVVSGSNPIQLALHPTHNSYQQFKKKGNPPLNLIPINQLPLSIGTNPLAPPPVATAHNPKPLPLWEKTPDTLYQGDDLKQCSPFNTDTEHCPQCQSINIKNNGTTSGGKLRKRCNDCGKSWSV